MAREKDFRTDPKSAGHIAEAMTIQARYGFDVARRHLLAAGVEPQLAMRMLAIRYDRRARPGAAGRAAGA